MQNMTASQRPLVPTCRAIELERWPLYGGPMNANALALHNRELFQHTAIECSIESID